MAGRISVVVMSSGALSEAAAVVADEAHSHRHVGDLNQPLAGPPPAFIHVAGEPVYESEIAREMLHHRAADPHVARHAAATTLVIRELLSREFDRLGLKVTPIDGETDEEAKIRILLDEAIETPAADDIAIRHYFESNRARLHHPARILARHVLLAAAPADPKARIRAQQLGDELIAAVRAEPQRFVEFAMRHSSCPSRDQGGDLGWIERGDTVAEFDRQLFMLRPGLAGLTVETRYGHHVVEVLERSDGLPLSYVDARPRILSYLETQARQNAVHQYLHMLADQYGVKGIQIDA